MNLFLTVTVPRGKLSREYSNNCTSGKEGDWKWSWGQHLPKITEYVVWPNPRATFSGVTVWILNMSGFRQNSKEQSGEDVWDRNKLGTSERRLLQPCSLWAPPHLSPSVPTNDGKWSQQMKWPRVSWKSQVPLTPAHHYASSASPCPITDTAISPIFSKLPIP